MATTSRVTHNGEFIPDMSLSTSSSTSMPTIAPPRDGFLDAIKVIALWRVVVWHALAWPWLSWFAAMPAMFYVAGVLLQQSLDKHGYASTLGTRLRRLLVPFWAFGLGAGAIMVIAGWQPRLLDLIWWIVPLGDPVGLDSTPGLWIPLWYLRAYVWLLVGGSALAWLCRRFGAYVLIAPAAATMAVWAWQGSGHDVPLAIADAALFPFFILAGMLTAMGKLDLSARHAVPVTMLAVTAAGGWYWFDGAPAGIVNGSLPLHLLVGVASVAALTIVRVPLSNPPAPFRRFIAWSSSRALTIYLWHGLGLLVADRVVHRFDLPGALAAASGLVVVVTVTVASGALLGPLEDRAASRRVRRTPRPVRLSIVPGVALVVVGLLASDLTPETARVVPSGQAVMVRGERAEIVAGDIDDLAARGTEVVALDEDAINAAFDAWIDENSLLLDELDTDLIEVALVDGNDNVVLVQWTRDGEPAAIDPFPWWSMSKTMTAAWMMQLSEEGIIDIEGPLMEYLAEVPHSDEITFEQLAGHRSGVPSHLDSNIMTASPIDEIGAFFDSPDLAFEPGEGFDYSRIGYHLLTWGLEEASGSSWRAAMEAIADGAGATITIDEDWMFSDRVTHPGGGDYRGNLWGAGGLHGTTIDGARLYRWTLMESLGEDAVRRMSTASSEDESFYGLGLSSFCPCVSDGAQFVSDRVGLSTITGSYVVDLANNVGLMLRTDNWWSEEYGPAMEFDELLHSLLTAAASP